MLTTWEKKAGDDNLKVVMKVEVLKWLELLLELIDVIADGADTNLKLFLKGTMPLTTVCKKEIRALVSLQLRICMVMSDCI